MPSSAAALLLLADGRFPAGGYAHSGGLEPSVAAGRVRDVETLEAFLRGRAATTGATLAAFAAAACGSFGLHDGLLEVLDAELDARTPSPAQRATSRSLGRQFVRAFGAIGPAASLAGLGVTPHHPVAVGAAASVVGLDRHGAALAVLHDSVAGPVAAAVRLLHIDPFGAYAALARLAPLLDKLAEAAVADSHGEVADLPARGAPLLDLAAEEHAVRLTRLFAS
jgi:urease accessory protein